MQETGTLMMYIHDPYLLMVMVVILCVSHTNSFAGKSDQMNSDVSIKCETTSQMHCATLSEWHHQFITLHLHLKLHSTVDLWNVKRWKFKSSIKRGGETANFLQGVRIVTTLGIFERWGDKMKSVTGPDSSEIHTKGFEITLVIMCALKSSWRRRWTHKEVLNK